jgi:hypothetical protein
LRSQEELDGYSGMMSLVNRPVFPSQGGEKGSEAGSRGSGIPKFLAEVQVKADPPVVFRMASCGEPSLLEALLKGCLGF